MHSRFSRAAGFVLAASSFFIIGFASVATADDAARPPVPLKDFVREAEFESTKISPTGQYLAAKMRTEGQSTLAIIELKTRKITGHLRWNKDHVYDYWWTGPDRVVVSIATQSGPLDQPRLTGELYAMNADGTGKRHLFGGGGWARMIDPLPDLPEFALIAIESWYGNEIPAVIERINVYNGNRTRLAIVPGAGPLDVATDRAGELRFAYSSDRGGKRHVYVRRDRPEGWAEIKVPQASTLDSVGLHGATPDGDTIYLTTTSAGRMCLREYRISKGTFLEIRCNDAGRVGPPVFSFDETTLVGMVHNAGRPEIEYLDAKHPDVLLRRGLEKSFPGQFVSIVSRSLDSQKLVVSAYSGQNPGDYYLVDRATKKAEYLMSERAWIDPAVMAPVSAIKYKTRDNATIHGFLTAAPGAETRNAPLVLMPHGGPHGIRDWWGWDPWAQALASRGYAVLQVNFRGSGGYGYEHERAGYQKWGTLMQDDLTDAVRWAVAEGIADPKRVCIMGASYGGYAALMSSMREPDLYKCAIGFAGVYELTSQTDDLAYSYLGRSYLERVFGSQALMAEQSPVTHVERLKVPVLIMHGTADPVVPFKQAKTLRRVLEKYGKTYEWVEYEDEEHGFHIEKNHVDFLEKCLAFLDKYIGPNAAVKAAEAYSGPASDPVSTARHHARHRAHELAHRPRQLVRAGRGRLGAVAFLVGAHRLDDRAAFLVAFRQLVQMPGEVLGDLLLGLLDEAQAPAVSGDAGNRADRERAGVPQRIEPARVRVQLAQAVLAPGQVRALLGGGLQHVLADRRVARDQRVALVQRLRGDLAGVVHAHQARRMAACLDVERRILEAGGGVRARVAAGWRRDAGQGLVQAHQQAVDGGVVPVHRSLFHAPIIVSARCSSAPPSSPRT
jgi:dipeptidyl aminopeptidase/acylaminoacyl peptidase